MRNGSLINIREASRVLGVSEAALRQWTDAGQIKAFVTPGGHRRYSKLELNKFLGSRKKIISPNEVAGELENTTQLLGNIGKASVANNAWLGHLDKESQRQLAQLGRSLLGLIIAYIMKSAKRDETISQARLVGEKFGETLANLGLSLNDSTKAFILHRQPILNAITQLIKRRRAFSGRALDAISLATHIMDETLVSLVNAHQRASARNEI